MQTNPLALSAIRKATAAMLLAIALPTIANAEETGHAEHGAWDESQKNYFAGFVGGANEGRDEAFAVAIEYERRLNERFGVGAVLEHTYGNLDIWVFAVPLALHSGRWKLYAAPGLEDAGHGSEALLRLGVEYGFHVGDWEISPQFDIDFVDGKEVFVLGVAFGQWF